MKKSSLTLTFLLLAAVFASPSLAKDNYWQLANHYEQRSNYWLQKGEQQGFIDTKALEMQYLHKVADNSRGAKKAEAYFRLGVSYLQLTFTQNGLRNQSNFDAAKTNFQHALETDRSLDVRIAKHYIDFGRQMLSNLSTRQLHLIFDCSRKFYHASQDYLISTLEAESSPNAAAILYIYTGRDAYRDLMLSHGYLDEGRNLQAAKYAYKVRPDPQIATALGNYYAGKLKAKLDGGYSDGVGFYREKAKQYLTDEQYQSHFPQPKWQPVPGSQKTFVGKGVDRDEYELKLAKWGDEIKHGQKVVIKSSGNKPFYVGEGNQFKKCINEYTRMIDFTPNNMYSMQAYAEKGEKLEFILLSFR